MRALSRYSIVAIVGVIVLGLQAPAYAVDYFLKNDSMGENFTGKIASAEVVANEMYTATFTLPASWQLPVELKGVRVLMVDGQDASKTYCGRFTIEVWEESNAAMSGPDSCPPLVHYKPPGSVIYSMSTQFQSNSIGFEVKGNSSNWQDLKFSQINNNPQLNVTINPVMLNTRKVRVGIKAIDNQCFSVSNANAFPVMVTDNDGASADNFLYGKADLCGALGTIPPPHFYYWSDFSQYFSQPPGDFVMRLIFDRPAQGGADVGVDAGADVGVDVGVDAGMDVGMDAGVDVAADTGGDIGMDAAKDAAADVATADTAASGTLNIESVSPESFPNTSATSLFIIGFWLPARGYRKTGRPAAGGGQRG